MAPLYFRRKNMTLIINGRFLTRPVTGVERVGRMLMDVIASEWPNSRIAVPARCELVGGQPALEVMPIGTTQGHFWEQVELPRVLESGDVLLSPANTGPLRCDRHVPFIHDLAFVHHPDWFNARFATWYRMLMPRMARKASRVLTSNAYVARELQRYFGISEDRIAIVPPFVHIDRHRAPIDPPHPRPYYLAVGSLDPRKGLDRVFNWFTGLQRHDHDLLIVGRPGRAFNPVDVPVHPRIVLLGDVQEERLLGLYRGATALVQGSYYEGFGLPVLEALACGCPVIAAQLPVFQENFGDALINTEIGYTRGMMRAMVRVSDPDERAALVANGEKVAKGYHREATRIALHNALDELICGT